MTNVTDLKAGDKIKALAVPGLSDQQVTELSPGVYLRHSSVVPNHIICNFDGLGDVVVTQWELVECADATPTEQRDNEIERLNERMKFLADEIAVKNTYIDNLKKALQIINARLNSEASDRGWCDEFDRILESVNREIASDAGGCYTLEGNEREFQVEVRGSSYVSWTHVVTVTARNEKEACRLVEDDPGLYFSEEDAAEEEINYGVGWDSHEITEASINS
jgi:predicted RNase H-like nuclease (RuvC/YqgF family)